MTLRHITAAEVRHQQKERERDRVEKVLNFIRILLKLES